MDQFNYIYGEKIMEINEKTTRAFIREALGDVHAEDLSKYSHSSGSEYVTPDSGYQGICMYGEFEIWWNANYGKAYYYITLKSRSYTRGEPDVAVSVGRDSSTLDPNEVVETFKWLSNQKKSLKSAATALKVDAAQRPVQESLENPSEFLPYELEAIEQFEEDYPEIADSIYDDEYMSAFNAADDEVSNYQDAYDTLVEFFAS